MVNDPINEQELEKLYNAVSSEFDIGDIGTFKNKMQNVEDRKRFYDVVNAQGFDIGDYNSYEERLSGVKKKDGSSGSTFGSGLSQSEFITLAKEQKELSSLKKGYQQNADYASQFGVPQKEISQYDSRLAEIKERLSGMDESFISDVADLPISHDYGYDLSKALALKHSNPEAYKRRMAGIGWQGALHNSIVEEMGKEAAEAQRVRIREIQEIKDYPSLRAGTQEVVAMAKGNDDIIKKIQDDRYAGYVADLQGAREAIDADARYIANGGNLNNYQVSAIHFLEDTDPKTAMVFNRLLSAQGVEDGLSDSKIGYDMKARELERIGLGLSMKYVQERLAENPEDTVMLAKYEELRTDLQNEASRYPAAAQMDAQRLMQEALSAQNSIVKRYFLNIGADVADAANWVGDLLTSPFLSDNSKAIRDLELLGDKEFQQSALVYSPDNEQMFGSDFKVQFSPEIKEQIDIIKADETKSYDDKANAVSKLIQENPDGIKMVPNASAGKLNFTSKAIFANISNVAAQLTSQLGLAALVGGAGNASKVRQLSTLAGSTAATTYDDHYADAIRDNIAHPSTYALTMTAIETASELINNDFTMVKKIVGTGSPLGKMLNNVSEETWNAVKKKGYFKSLLETGKRAVSNAVDEMKEEVLGGAAANLAEKYAFDQDVEFTDGLGQSAVTTMAAMIPLGMLGLPFQLNKIHRNRKQALYELGSNAESFLQRVDSDLQAGIITQSEAEARIKTIERAKAALKSTPVTKTDGTPLTDNEKTEYAFNQAVIQDIKEQQKSVPPAVKEELEQKKQEVEVKLTEIVSPELLQKPTGEEIKLVNEIISLPLSRVEGFGAGSQQAEGTYISTEPVNSYAERLGVPAKKVKVDIKKPKLLTSEEEFALRTRLLNENRDQLDELDYELEDTYTHPFDLDRPLALDDLSDSGIKKVAKMVTKHFQDQGYDSIYFRQTDIQEGELIVFDRAKVSHIEEEAPPKRKAGKSVKSPGIMKVAAGIEDIVDPFDRVMQHIVSGQKLHPSVIQELFGGKNEKIRQSVSVDGERKSRIGMLSKAGLTIDEFAHQLWESDSTGKFDTQDYRNAIENALLSYKSPGAMAKALKDKYIDNAVQNELTDEEAKDFTESYRKQIIKFVEEMPQDQQEALIGILEKYQNQYGFIDWDKLEEDSNGFDPDILNLPTDVQNSLYAIIEKNSNQDNQSTEGEHGGPLNEGDIPQQETTAEPTDTEPTDTEPADTEPTGEQHSIEQNVQGADLSDADPANTSQQLEDATDPGLTAVKQNRGRIKVAPIFGKTPKELRKMIYDVTRSTKLRLFFIKPSGRRKAIGTYSPGNAAIKIKWQNDLDTTAHELGHAIDDNFGVLAEAVKYGNPFYEAELKRFSDHGGSQPPSNVSAKVKRQYIMGEGFAEFVRGLIVNPEETKKIAPLLYSLYEKNVDPEFKKAIEQFSEDVRVFAGAKGVDKILANTEWEPEAKQGWLYKMMEKTDGNNDFVITFWERMKANLLNPFQALDKAVNHLRKIHGIEKLLPKDDPEVLTRALLHVGAKVDSVINDGMIDSKLNRLKDDKGNAKNLEWLIGTLDATTEGTLKKELQETHAYMIAERTLELSKRFGRHFNLSGVGGGVFTDTSVAEQTINEFNSWPKKKRYRIFKAAERYRELADDVMKYMVDKGRLSKEAYIAIKQNNLHYVGMQRILEAEPHKEIIHFRKESSGSLGAVKDVIYRAEGSSATIGNVYVNLLDTLSKAIREADRNDVMRSVRDLLVNNRGMYQGDIKKISNIAVPVTSDTPNKTTIYVNGKPEYWKFQEDVYKALHGIDVAANELPLILTALPKLLRWTVTNSPIFAARNIVRDTQDRIIKSNENGLLNAFGLASFVGDSKHWKDVAVAGGLNAGYYMKDRKTYYGLMNEAITRLAKDKKTILLDPMKLAKTSWGRYTDLLQKGETLNRVAEYRAAYSKAKKQGMNDYDAMLYAGNKSASLLDFAMMGHWMRTINQLIPFSNAAVQGLRSTYNRATENPVAFTLRLLLKTFIPQATLWMIAHSNDDDAAEYEAMPDYQRDMFWNLKIGNNNWISVPKPYELGMVASASDRVFSYARGNKNAFNGYMGSVAKSLIPIDESNASGPYRSLIEIMANYDFFREQHIIPPKEEGANLALRETDRASRLGKLLSNTLGFAGKEVDPRYVDHFVKSAASYYGNYAVKASNIGRNDGDKFGIPDLGFFKNSPAYNSKPVQEFLSLTKEFQLSGSSKKDRVIGGVNEVNIFYNLASDYFEAKTDEEKEIAAKALRDFAATAVAELKLKGIEKVEKVKHQKAGN